MKPAAVSFLPNIPVLGIWLLVYYLAGIISMQFDNPELHVALIWFPAGVSTAAFLRYSMRHWPVLLLSFITINLLVNHPFSGHLLFKMVFAVVSLPSSLAIAWIIKRFARPLDDINIIFYWFTTTLIVSLVDSLCFALGFTFDTQKSFGQIFWAWFIADISGNFFSTTVIMGFINQRLRPSPHAKPYLLLGAVIWLFMVFYTLWAFSGNANAYSFSRIPGLRDIVFFALTIIPVVLTAFMTLLCGNRGGALALLTLGSIVIFYADKGLGPLFLKRLHDNEALLLVQIYLMATSLFLVFLRIITQNISHIGSGNQLRNNRQAIYQLNLGSGTLSWDTLPPQLAALPLTTLNNRQQLLAQLHPHDITRLDKHWQADAKAQKLPTISFRLRDGQGGWLHITDSDAVLIDNRGSLFIVGNWSLSS